MASSQVRNNIRRALREVVDKSPKRHRDVPIWLYFRSRCAYCGTIVHTEKKEGHIDHLVSVSAGGSNHIRNRVLACANCNESEKREMDWEDFLRQKAGSELVFNSRRQMILEWQAKQGDLPDALGGLLGEADRMATEVIAMLDERLRELRSLRDNFK